MTPSGADLHIHTTHSDGACSPCEVVIAAHRVGLSALSINDHDTVTALAVARPEAARWGIELIGGVELTAQDDDGREIHILGHFVRDDDSALRAATDRLRAARADRLVALTDRLTVLGLWIDLPALSRAFPRATIGRRHLAEWLVRTRQVASLTDAFARYLGDDGPAHVPKPRLPWAEAIALLHASGGTAALAHPRYDLRERALASLVAGGLDAIETNGPGVPKARSARLRAWAEHFDLIPIAGSDFHTHDRPGRWIGSRTTPVDELERLRARSHLSPSSSL